MERRARLRSLGVELLFSHGTLLPELWETILGIARAQSRKTRLVLRRVCKAWWALDGEIVYRLSAPASRLRGSSLTVGITAAGLYCDATGAHVDAPDAFSRRVLLLFYWLCTPPDALMIEGGTYVEFYALVMAVPTGIGVTFYNEYGHRKYELRASTYGKVLGKWLSSLRFVMVPSTRIEIAPPDHRGHYMYTIFLSEKQWV